MERHDSNTRGAGTVTRRQLLNAAPALALAASIPAVAATSEPSTDLDRPYRLALRLQELCDEPGTPAVDAEYGRVRMELDEALKPVAKAALKPLMDAHQHWITCGPGHPYHWEAQETLQHALGRMMDRELHS